ncbi:hypothetical protein LWC34_05715 [Kibdelosporangium philippinense]|uniref:DUF3558 domain-containing protein n=1 Tax=Kibdelosporangium philippinense TaxID=211113 RepID=A0ABS8Z314_9PSEU|nr:hypothetical protein [Kibdelosporangium philippinense]MCE7002329.1 hypothetical protein [Kibdelosporangium philippinense]
MLAVALTVTAMLGYVPACASTAEPPRFSNLPAKCFAGLDDTLKELAGPLYGLQRFDGPDLPANGTSQMTCTTKFQDSANTLKRAGQPYQRDITIMYSLYLDDGGQDAVTRAKDNFRSSVIRPANVTPSSSLNVGEEAASWPGNANFSGWNVEFRESNLVVVVTVAGSDYAMDFTGKVTVQEWSKIPGELRGPAELAAKGVAQHPI